ncbi:pyridoxal kinase PdxY [Microlunatus speluncae]|uniref:pyridoxal kinase PdxY n=1 Tax=Microlunatus speluncae TaxID=2594267 RepID=UPI0012663652|nr:pyridoxal kinase PdxY [Microlunatus speluncae]
MTAILSIQSSVAYGHVGNSAATFPLMRLGVEVWPVITVHFSNHTGYESWRGPLLAAGDIAEVIKGLDERGVLSRCDAVLSGYQGAAEVGAVILDAVALVKQRNPDAIYCCDPVMGDVGRGFYVREGIPEFMRDRVVPAAQLITPNQFELEYLTGRSAKTLDDVLAAADAARAMGPETVLVTSVTHDLVAEDTLQMIAVTETEAWSVTIPLLRQTFTGSGDLTAATFLAHTLTTDLPTALSRTAAIVHGVLSATVESGQTELQLVAAQDEIADPSHTFEATRLR